MLKDCQQKGDLIRIRVSTSHARKLCREYGETLNGNRQSYEYRVTQQGRWSLIEVVKTHSNGLYSFLVELSLEVEKDDGVIQVTGLEVAWAFLKPNRGRR